MDINEKESKELKNDASSFDEQNIIDNNDKNKKSEKATNKADDKNSPEKNIDDNSKQTESEESSENEKKASLVKNSVEATREMENLDLSIEEINAPKPEKEKGFFYKLFHKEEVDPEHEPPLESLPDNLTDEDIELFMQEQQKKLQAEEEEDESEYENLTEEEIKEKKEQKRKFEELKIRFNSKESSGNNDNGDYRRNLDFSVNTGVKRFKVKPPKKPFIIAFTIAFALAIIGVVIALIVTNKPPEPIRLKSIAISQTTTYQYVGDKVDLRGLYITKTYSNGSKKDVAIKESMIYRTSANINSENQIFEYNNNTFVYFRIESFEVKLDIQVTDIEITGITANIYKSSIVENCEIKFNEILVLATVKDIGVKKIDTKNVELYIDDVSLVKTSTGFVLPEGIVGNKTIKVVCQTFSAQVNIVIQDNPEL